MYHTQNSSSSKRAWEEAAHLISSSTTEKRKKNPSVLKTWRNPGQFYNVSPPAISSNRSWMKEESREVIDLDLYYTLKKHSAGSGYGMIIDLFSDVHSISEI